MRLWPACRQNRVFRTSEFAMYNKRSFLGAIFKTRFEVEVPTRWGFSIKGTAVKLRGVNLSDWESGTVGQWGHLGVPWGLLGSLGVSPSTEYSVLYCTVR